jgi:ribulose kinase
MHVGISLDTSVTSLALVYYATLEAIALQTRHIVEALNAIPTTATLSSSSLITGTSTSVPHHQVKFLFLSGGLVKNNLLMQLLADTCAMPVVLPYSHSASVVLGAAMLGAAAFSQQEGHKESLWDIMVKAFLHSFLRKWLIRCFSCQTRSR